MNTWRVFQVFTAAGILAVTVTGAVDSSSVALPPPHVSGNLRPVQPTDGSVSTSEAPALYGISGGGNVELGQTVVLSVLNYGEPQAWTYQWLRGDALISGATGSSYTIDTATPGDAGTYSVRVSNAAGTSIASTAVTVKPAAAPVIVQHPSSMVRQVGQQAFFMYVGNGSYPRMHQWRKNGVDIPGATLPYLTVDGLTLADAGTYSVVVTNSLGVAVSESAALTVNAATPPVIYPGSPPDITATAGSEVSLYASFTSGSEPFTYAWRKNGVIIADATQRQLTFSTIQSADAGRYSVTVSNSAGTATSREAVVVVTPPTPISFHRQPRNVSVYVGQDASFDVGLEGSHPISVQWLKDGVAVPNATSTYLTIRSITAADAGRYSVQATNPAGTARSSEATLTVNPAVAPAITRAPAGGNLLFNEYFNLSVDVTGSPPLRYQWYKNGVAVAGAVYSGFSLSQPTPADSGIYTVVVTNTAGSVTSPGAILTVAAAVLPTITTEPASINVPRGLSAEISVRFQSVGAGQVSLQWYKDGKPIVGAIQTSYGIPSVEAKHAGVYTVVLTGPAGSITSSGARLSVLSPAAPKITWAPNDTTRPLGDYAEFRVSVNGSPPFSYQWYKDGIPIEGAVSSELRVPVNTLADAGSYHVVVSNDGGVSASAPAELRITVGSSAGPWLEATRLGSLVYFLAAAPSRIERYDLAAESWLPTKFLSDVAAPTAFVPTAEGVYIAYGRTLVRRSPDLVTETRILEASNSIKQLIAYDDFLYYNEGADIGGPMVVLRRSTLQPQTSTTRGFKAIAFSAQQRRGYGVGGGYSEDAMIVAIDANGVFSVEPSQMYHGDVPNGSRLVLFPAEDRVANTGGTVYSTDDLTYTGSFGAPIDDLVFLSDATPVVLRQRVLSTCRKPGFGEVARASVPFAGLRAFARDDTVFVFGAPEFSGGPLRVAKISATAFQAPALPAVTNGAGERFSIDQVYCSEGGIVHLLSRSKRAMVRWSSTTQTYLPAVPLRGVPRISSVIHGTSARALLAYVDGTLTEIRFTGAAPAERTIAAVGNRVGAITDLADKVMLNVYNYSSSADRRLVLGASGQSLYLSGWSYWGAGLAYHSGTRRLYSDGRFGVAEAEYEIVPESGVLPAGTNSVSNPTRAVEAPLCLTDDGALMVAGNGRILNADLAEMGVIGASPIDAAWLPAGLYSLSEVAGHAQVQQWSRTRYLLNRTATFEGVPLRLFRLDDSRLLLVCTRDGVPVFTILKDDLRLASASTVPPVQVADQPRSVVTPVSSSLSIALALTGGEGALNCEWFRDGRAIGGVGGAMLTMSSFGPELSGIYSANVAASDGSTNTTPIIAGVSSTSKAAGEGREFRADIVHPSGRIFDQVLMEGSAASITADAGQVTRMSYIDIDDDIVQVEFSGAGTATVVLSGYTGPASPANYNQSGITYMKGQAAIVVTGANESTHLSVFSVGRANAVDQALFRTDAVYDGVADLAYIAIASKNGKFGSVRCANSNFFASRGLTGLYAPGVGFTGPVYIGDISAYDDASPVLMIGSAANVTQINGGDLSQANGRAVQVAGLTRLEFVNGTTSHGVHLPAQANGAKLEENGIDVTDAIVVNPTP